MTNPENDAAPAPLPSTHPTSASAGCAAATRHHPTPASTPLAKRPRCAVTDRRENVTNTLAQSNDDDDLCPPHPDVDSNPAAAPSSDHQQCVHPIPEPPSQPYSPLLPSLPLQDHAPLQSPLHDATCSSTLSPNRRQPPPSSPSFPQHDVPPRAVAAADLIRIEALVHPHPTPHHAVTSTTPPTRRPRPEGLRIRTRARRHRTCHGRHQSGCRHCRCRCSCPCDVVVDDDDDIGSQGASIVQAMQTQPRPLGPSFLSSGGGQISAAAREYLVSWQADLCFCCAMRKHTLAVAVRLLDELLALGGVCLSRAYVIATACLFIASKLEEVGPVSVRTFAAMIHVAYVRSATNNQMKRVKQKQKQKQMDMQLNRNLNNKDGHIEVDDDGDVNIVGSGAGYNPSEAVHKTVTSMSKFPLSIERFANNMANQQLQHQQQLQRYQQQQQQQQQLSSKAPQRQRPVYKIPASNLVPLVSAPASKQPSRPPHLRSHPGLAPSSSSTAAMNNRTHPSVTVSNVTATAAADSGTSTAAPNGGGIGTTSARSIPLSQPVRRIAIPRAQAVTTATETATKDTGTGTGSGSGAGDQNSNAMTTTNDAAVREKMAKGILLAERYVLDKLGYDVTKQTALGIVEWIAEQAVKSYGCCLNDEDDDYENEDEDDPDKDTTTTPSTTPSSSISLLSPFSTSSPSPTISQCESHPHPHPQSQPRSHCKSKSHSQCCHRHHDFSGTGTNTPTEAEDVHSNQFGNRVATDAQFAVMVGLLDAKVAGLSGTAVAVGAVRVALCVNGKNGAGIARWANVKGVASAVAALVAAWHHVDAYSDEQRKSIAVLDKAETEIKGFRLRDGALRTLVDRVHEELEAWHADDDGVVDDANGDDCGGRCGGDEKTRRGKGRRKGKWECKGFCRCCCCCCCRSRCRSATVEKNGSANAGSINRQMMVSVSPCTDNDNDNNNGRKEVVVDDDTDAKDDMSGNGAMKKRAVKKGGTKDKAGAGSGCDVGAGGVVAHKRKRGQR